METIQKSSASRTVGLKTLEIEYLAAPELAQRLSLSVHTIRKWKAMGLIPYRKFGRAIRYKQDEVVRAVEGWRNG